MPAYLRGQYFTGSDQFMTFSAFTLHFSFSIMSWIRPDTLASSMSLFSKDRDAFPNGTVFYAFVEATTGSLGVNLADSDDTFATSESLSSTEVVTASAWSHVGYSVKLDDTNTANCSVRMWVDTNSG